MIGSWRWTAGFACFGAILTFLFSLGHNPLGTTAMRALYAFVAFGLLSMLARFALTQLLRPAHLPGPPQPIADEARGAVLDMTTPGDDESLSDLMKQQWTGAGGEPVAGFQPLTPPKLVSLDHPEPEEVVQAIRRLTDE
ncbi:hypothetical protein [Cohnella nanjingensis]|uniref:Uncharacterized protein n=1 Tax=Cohnella nanjingensis TaxID=1387779 RepID=A0A7X0VIS7_9BACL|nr:hypothetical protein [Cohnella nanjingensis]MBB6675535.1 hypothetical protein [Cohnella nanjingensis]